MFDDIVHCPITGHTIYVPYPMSYFAEVLVFRWNDYKPHRASQLSYICVDLVGEKVL